MFMQIMPTTFQVFQDLFLSWMSDRPELFSSQNLE